MVSPLISPISDDKELAVPYPVIKIHILDEQAKINKGSMSACSMCMHAYNLTNSAVSFSLTDNPTCRVQVNALIAD